MTNRMMKTISVVAGAFLCLRFSISFRPNLLPNEFIRTKCQSTFSRTIDEFSLDDGSFSEYENRCSVSSLKIGEWYDGVVTNVVTFGAFVDIGAELDGLVHKSQLSDNFTFDASEVVSEGQRVKVKIRFIDFNRKRLILSMRRAPSPSHIQPNVDLSYYLNIFETEPGRFLDGKVDTILNYGAFVTLEENCKGFLHISQLLPKNEEIKTVHDELSIGQDIKVRLRKVDFEKRRINLSLLPLVKSEIVSPIINMENFDRTKFYNATVVSVQSYGVFANIDGVNGMLHISRISDHQKITAEYIRQNFASDQVIEVRIFDIDLSTNRLLLSMLPYRPWAEVPWFSALIQNDFIEGKISAFSEDEMKVLFGPGLEGSLPISEKCTCNLGDKINVRIIDVDARAQTVKLSVKGEDEEKSAFVDMMEKGEKLKRVVEGFSDLSSSVWMEGEVTSFAPYGAFVRFYEDISGLLHISKISTKRINSVENLLKIGQRVSVRVISFHPETAVIGLSMLKPNECLPYKAKAKKLAPDVKYLDKNLYHKGFVKKIFHYGCLVSLDDPNPLVGLLHISQISDKRIPSTGEMFKNGDPVDVRIIEIREDGNIFFSMLKPGSPKDLNNMAQQRRKKLELRKKLLNKAGDAATIDQDDEKFLDDMVLS